MFTSLIGSCVLSCDPSQLGNLGNKETNNILIAGDENPVTGKPIDKDKDKDKGKDKGEKPNS